jgi:hypothetical protein
MGRRLDARTRRAPLEIHANPRGRRDADRPFGYFEPEFQKHYAAIVDEIRRRVGPSGGAIFASGIMPMNARTAEGLAKSREGASTPA